MRHPPSGQVRVWLHRVLGLCPLQAIRRPGRILQGKAWMAARLPPPADAARRGCTASTAPDTALLPAGSLAALCQLRPLRATHLC